MTGTSTILVGDCRERLAEIAPGTVQCCVTSPPYYSLRDYGCAGQIGLEPKAWQYIETLVKVFRLVREALHETGTVWLNLGDCHAGKQLQMIPAQVALALQADGWLLRSDIVWAKSISGAYRGGSCMPESVTDRPTRSHEYLFLLAKSERYYFDQEAVREALAPWNPKYGKQETPPAIGSRGGTFKTDAPPEANWNRNPGGIVNVKLRNRSAGRNIRSVWHHSPQAFSGAHFAVMPPALVLPCVRAGTSQRGCCVECGAPWERVVEAEHIDRGQPRTPTGRSDKPYGKVPGSNTRGMPDREKRTTGWRPTCACPGACAACEIGGASGSDYGRTHTCDSAAPPIPCTVLDPFAGAGTTGLVATQNGRDFIGIELNPEYAEMARKRIANPASVGRPKEQPDEQIGLFGGSQ